MNISNTSSSSSIAMKYGNSNSGVNPFTANQWQELEHQALIYKYLISGIPVPPDLLFPLKRSPGGWSCYHHQYQHHPTMTMLGSRKIDPEPGRCRRTDGKKWRCSKEAYPDSKYCERHMHRGKNRSRKHVDQHHQLISTSSNATSTASAANPLTGRNTSSLYSLDANSGLTRSVPSETTPHHSNYFLDSGTGSYSEYYRYAAYGLKEGEEGGVDEHAFFSEPSGTMRNFSAASSLEDSWQLTPLTMSSSSSSRSRQSDYSSYLQLQSLGDYKESKPSTTNHHHYLYEMPVKHEREPEEPNKTIHRFFDEAPIREGSRNSWLDQDEKSSNSSTTRLSISMPSSSSNDHFPLFGSRRDNNG